MIADMMMVVIGLIGLTMVVGLMGLMVYVLLTMSLGYEEINNLFIGS